MSTTVIKARVTHQPGSLGAEDCGLREPHGNGGVGDPVVQAPPVQGGWCTCLQVGRTLTLMVRSAESAAESTAACLEEAAFWQSGESTGICRELAETVPEAGVQVQMVVGTGFRARPWEASDGWETLRDASPSGALGALGKNPDSVGGRQRVPKVALATDSQVTLGWLLCVSGPQPLLNPSLAAWQGLWSIGLWGRRNWELQGVMGGGAMDLSLGEAALRISSKGWGGLMGAPGGEECRGPGPRGRRPRASRTLGHGWGGVGLARRHTPLPIH